MGYSPADSFPDIGGFKYGTDIDSVFKFTGRFDDFSIYQGGGKWKPYELDNINVFTDLSPVEDDKALKANLQAIDNAGGEVIDDPGDQGNIPGEIPNVDAPEPEPEDSDPEPKPDAGGALEADRKDETEDEPE